MKKELNYILMLGLITLTISILLRSIKVSNLIYLFQHTNKICILIGCILMIIFWITDAWILRELSVNILGSHKAFSTFNAAMIGQYYGMITPFASGAQPAQLYYMGKNKVPLGIGAAILLNKYVIYESVVTSYSLVLYIVHIKTYSDIARGLLPFLNIGFMVHIVGVVGIILLIYSPKTVEVIIKFFLKLGKKLKIIRNFESKLKKIENFMEEYKSSLLLVFNNKKLIIKITCITFMQLTVFFYVTYFVYKALYLNASSQIEIISLQAMLNMAVSFIPTPGTLGASESGYYTLFKSIFPSDTLLTYSLLLWRGITFYFNLVISGLFSLLFYLKDKRTMKIN